jgi:putative FmdB family regulatory protein
MPLYEYFCNACTRSFEALIPLSASTEPIQACPGCSLPAYRILSAVNIAADRGGRAEAQNERPDRVTDVTRLKLPPSARLCWMDDHAAARVAAYKAGRGAEYEETVALRKERAQERGEGVGSPAEQRHSHSPLSDPTVFANRRRAAQKEKAVESAAIRPPTSRAESAGGN